MNVQVALPVKVLDVGCGGGILAESMARRGADVLGIDMGEAPLAVGRLHAQQENVQNIEYRQIQLKSWRKNKQANMMWSLVWK